MPPAAEDATFTCDEVAGMLSGMQGQTNNLDTIAAKFRQQSEELTSLSSSATHAVTASAEAVTSLQVALRDKEKQLQESRTGLSSVGSETAFLRAELNIALRQLEIVVTGAAPSGAVETERGLRADLDAARRNGAQQRSEAAVARTAAAESASQLRTTESSLADHMAASIAATDARNAAQRQASQALEGANRERATSVQRDNYRDEADSLRSQLAASHSQAAQSEKKLRAANAELATAQKELAAARAEGAYRSTLQPQHHAHHHKAGDIFTQKEEDEEAAEDTLAGSVALESAEVLISSLQDALAASKEEQADTAERLLEVTSTVAESDAEVLALRAVV
jgi:hypothetical protein